MRGDQGGSKPLAASPTSTGTPSERAWNVPHPRNPFFTGREKVLEQLHQALASGKTTALAQPHAISGLGGIGKTQTAVEYAYRYRDEYAAVLWVKAETRETLLADFVALASVLNLPEQAEQDQNIAVAAVKRWLDHHTNWLFILDNADDLKLVREFLPAPGKGHVLLTTRAQATGAVAERIEIDEMEPREGALFLLRRANRLAKDAELDAVSATEREKAEEISQELGGLPLALDQAGAFILETPASLDEYRNLYRQEGPKLLAQRGDLPPDNHASVTVTFTLAFQQVEAKSQAAADVIRVCAFLAPDAIPEEIFTEGRVELGEHLSMGAAKPADFLIALREAGRFSLIARNTDEKTLDIHRLVQQVVKETMDRATQRQWAERVIRAVNSAFPHVEVANWGVCEQFLPHVQVCAELMNTWGLELHEAARLLTQAGFYLYERAHYVQAEPLYQRALAIAEKVSGPEHPDTAGSLNNLALLYYNQGLYGQAEPLYQRALATAERVLGPEHPNTATSLNNLAMLYASQDLYRQAKPLYQRALAIAEKVSGPEHPDTAGSLNNLALLYVSQRLYAQAEPLLQRALAIAERVLGPEHPDTATSLNNLAGLYDTQGLYAQAEPLYQRALAIQDKTIPDHPNTATFLESYAELLRKTNREAEAEPFAAHARAIREKQGRENKKNKT